MNQDFQSRREFFKKAIKGTLPFLGALTFPSCLLTACSSSDDEFDDDFSSGDGSSSGGGGCGGNCASYCMN